MIFSDCQYIENILTDEETQQMFYILKQETAFTTMQNKGGDVPRLIAQQSDILCDGQLYLIPVYRHPCDHHPPQRKYTNIVKMLRDRIEDVLHVERGYFNHCLIQLYSDSKSHITDHSDKTLDIKKDSLIVNLSLGATRVMKIAEKVKTDGARKAERIPLKNGSLFVLGWNTNRRCRHGIHMDNRDAKFKTADEMAFNGERISLTFRNIATYIEIASPDEVIEIKEPCKLVGQGAGTGDAMAMLKAFSQENNDPDFEYSEGFYSIDLSGI